MTLVFEGIVRARVALARKPQWDRAIENAFLGILLTRTHAGCKFARCIGSIERSRVSLIESDRIGSRFQLHGLSPDQRLLVIYGGDHQVVGAGGNSGESSCTVSIAADGGSRVCVDRRFHLWAIGGVSTACSAGVFVGRRSGRDGDSADGKCAAVAVAKKYVRTASQGIGSARHWWKPRDDG